MHVKIDCDHVSKRHVHCNKYTILRIDDPSNTVAEIIADSQWTMAEDGDVLCDIHAGE